MALADKLKETPVTRKPKSRVRTLLDFLKGTEEHTALMQALEDPEVQHITIARALAEEYAENQDFRYSISVASIKRYRDAIGVAVGSQG